MQSRRMWRALLAAVLLSLFIGPAAHAACNTCAIDFNLNGARDAGDINLFLALYGAGNSYADIDADGIITPNDVTVFVAYYGMATCPCWGDYNGDRFVDVNDLLIFLNLYSIGSGRADVNQDGFVNTQDILAWIPCFGLPC